MTMRIAFLTAEFPALSETFIVNQITGLIERGHRVDIFADRPRGDAIVNPSVDKYRLLARTHYWPEPPPTRLRRAVKAMVLVFRACLANPRMALIAIRSLTLRESLAPFSRLYLLSAATSLRSTRDYDVIHCQFGPEGIKGAFLCEAGALRGRLVVSFRGYDLSGFVRAHGAGIYCHLFKQADLLLPVSEKMKRQLLEMGCAANRVEVLRSGIDVGKFALAKHSEEPAAPTRIVSVGRCVEKKGFEYGIRAVVNLVEAGHNVAYRIVGDGPLRVDLERLVGELGARKSVKFLGTRLPDEVARILKDSDIMLTPSVTAANGDQEGIPNTAREGMAAALPVVATDDGSIRELIEDGKSGFIVPERDVCGLAEKLRVLAQDSTQRRAMGEKGRAFVEEHDDIAKINDRLMSLYRKAIESGGVLI